MIDKISMNKAAEYIKNHVNAPDWTFSIGSNEQLRTRFAQNGITQHIGGNKDSINLSLAFEGKSGSASINDTSQNGLDYLISTAETIARRNLPDPEYVAPAPKQDLPQSNNFSEFTNAMDTSQLVDIVEKCVQNAQTKNAKVSGMTERGTASMALFNSEGFEGFYQYTSFAHSMTMKKGGVETKVNRSMLDASDFSINTLIDQLNDQFHSLSDPKPIKAEKMPVILRPAAVADWFVYLFWLLDRRSADEGVTPFTDQIGNKFFGDKFSMRSLLDMPGLMAPPFSGDGIPAKNVDWISKGVLNQMITSRYYAKLKGSEPLNPYNIYIDGDSTTEEEMMKMVPRGVILNKLWYIRNIDRKAGTQTGLTRDGVLYFEDGKIVGSVNNFRWNDILHDVTRRIIALGKSQLIETWCQVPTMLIDDFNFVDTTSF